VSEPSRRIRADLPFHRIAVVFAGGGAQGAYHVGVFRALERAGLDARILLGVSAGAINTLIWAANRMRSERLQDTWRRLRPSSFGIRWITLAYRAFGAFLVSFGLLELMLTLGDLRDLTLVGRLQRTTPLSFEWDQWWVELVAWTLAGAIGMFLILRSDSLEDALSRWTPATDPERVRRVFGRIVLTIATLLVVSLAFPFPWPYRLHILVLLLTSLVWLTSELLAEEGAVRRFVVRLLPETGGRGLWRSGARRRLIEDLMPPNAAARLFDAHTHLIFTACAADTGRMHYFINWNDVTPEFTATIARAPGVVHEARDVRDLIEAAVASSALPLIFEPVRIGGQDYVDGGVFASRPLHVVLADGADAMLVVLMSPEAEPASAATGSHLIDFAIRMPQIANWRQMHMEILSLPAEWSREARPAKLCVVEPEAPLPGSLLSVDPSSAAEMIDRGENDAWHAMDRAGWLTGEPTAS
jgi:predicted acylesterase/phospholipase RssA